MPQNACRLVLESALTSPTTLPILAINSDDLRKPSTPVLLPKDSGIRVLSAAMIETMRAYRGAGLAAPQIGVNLRMFVMVDDDGMPLTCINPEITERSEEMQHREEGCLSMPGVFFEVERHKRVKVRFTDLDGAEHEREFVNIGAICFQHELDHLDGIRAIDRVSPLKRQMLMSSWRKLKKKVERQIKAPAVRPAGDTAIHHDVRSPTA